MLCRTVTDESTNFAFDKSPSAIVTDVWSTPAATASAIWVAVVGVISYMFMPLLVGGMAEALNFSSEELGLVAGAEAGGMALANAIAAFQLRRSDWRRLILLSCVIMVLANVASISIRSLLPMILARSVDGLAGGMLIAVGVACLSDNKKADTVFGYFVATEMIVSSIGFLVLPAVRTVGGIDGLFLALAVLSASGLVALFAHPSRGRDRGAEDETQDEASHQVALTFVVLLGALLFFMSQGGMWTFIERIGAAGGLSGVEIGEALALSSLCGIAGALGAKMISTWVGPLLAFALVLAGDLLCVGMLYFSVQFPVFVAASCLFIFLWSLGLPLMLVQCNTLDSSGRLVILLYAVGKLGYMVGPALMGLLVRGTDFSWVLAATVVMSAAGMVVSMVLCSDAVRRRLRW